MKTRRVLIYFIMHQMETNSTPNSLFNLSPLFFLCLNYIDFIQRPHQMECYEIMLTTWCDSSCILDSIDNSVAHSSITHLYIFYRILGAVWLIHVVATNARIHSLSTAIFLFSPFLVCWLVRRMPMGCWNRLIVLGSKTFSLTWFTGIG